MTSRCSGRYRCGREEQYVRPLTNDHDSRSGAMRLGQVIPCEYVELTQGRTQSLGISARTFTIG